MNVPDNNSVTRRFIGLAMRVPTPLSPPACLKPPTSTACATNSTKRNNLCAAGRSAAAYDGTLLDCGCRAAIIVNNEIILKLKLVPHILPLHEAQLPTCLRLGQCRIGLLLNFNTLSLKDSIRRRLL